jgi:outer membrane protein assembly factor BamD
MDLGLAMGWALGLTTVERCSLRRAFLSLTGQRFRLRAAATTWLALGVAAGTLLVAATPCDAQWYHKKKKVNKSTSPENTAEPDKILYDRAMSDVKRGRHETGRLALQTLINTYPDSEYLAKAKLAIADSFFKEGGTANLAQAIQTYKDFGIFFPFLSEAAYAQLQVANAHYQQMAKPDRDRSEAKAAEEEYQVFLQKYPNDPLALKAEQRLRNVQEIIAQGDYLIGYFYYVKGDQRAAAARLMTLSKRYPLFSKADKTLWMLGSIFEKSEHKEIASLYYSQIVRNYPLSGYVGDAKTKLTDFKVPIPQPDPKAMAWMTAEQKAPRERETLLKKPLALVRSGPRAELFVAAQSGQPNLEPEADTTSATDILSGGNRSQIGVSSGGPGSTAVVETVTPGGAAPSDTAAKPSPAEGAQPPAEASTPANSPAAIAPNGAATEPVKPAASDASGAAPAAPATDNSQSADAPNSGTKQDKSNGKKEKESSSKKKKHKVLPW